MKTKKKKGLNKIETQFILMVMTCLQNLSHRVGLSTRTSDRDLDFRSLDRPLNTANRALKQG